MRFRRAGTCHREWPRRKGVAAFDAATQNLAEVKGSTLKIRQFDCDDERAIDRTVTVELPRKVADNMVGITANVGSGDRRSRALRVMTST